LASLLALLLLLPGDVDAAEKALDAGKPGEAIRLLGDLADQEEVHWRTNAVLGRAHLQLREYEAAVEPLLRAAEERPDDKLLARDAAYACWGSAKGVYARAYLDDALRMARKSGNPLLIADIQYALGDFTEALNGYEEVKEEASTRLRVLIRIAECLGGLGRTEAAQEAHGAALEEAIRKEDMLAAYRSAFAAERAGRLLNWLDERVAANPKDPWARLYRGYTRARLLMFGEAAADLRIAVLARPDDLDAQSQLCRALIRLGLNEQRREALEEGESVARGILAKDPRQPGAWEALRWLAWHYWVTRDVERSYRLLKHLHALDPEEADVGLNFAAMARRVGHHEESRKTYEILLDAYPEDPDVLNDLGILRDGLGDRVAAVDLWNRVLKEDRENLNALENLFTAAWERGDKGAMDELALRGLAAARRAKKEGPIARWIWFMDRISWAPAGHGG
jgi:tetratricopeptide (TPR) repeat protein